jgi:hydrogenase nickel incorporation protein HypA/HybF
MACEESSLKGSHLIIEEVPVAIFCSNCKALRAIGSIQLFCCADCGTPASEIVQGKEIEVFALEIAECQSPV